MARREGLGEKNCAIELPPIANRIVCPSDSLRVQAAEFGGSALPGARALLPPAMSSARPARPQITLPPKPPCRSPSGRAA
jgi:hypothetical protein